MSRNVQRLLIWYGVFLIVLGFHSIWKDSFGDGYDFFGLYFLGGLVWVGVYLLVRKFTKVDWQKWVVWAVFGLAILLGSLNIVGRVFSINQLILTPQGVVGWAVVSRDHSHLGDYFALVGIVGIYKLLKEKKKFWWWICLAISAYFMWWSRSRSAYVSFAMGSVYVWWFYGKKSSRKILWWALGLAVFLLLYTGLTKPLLLNRQYWLQGFLGFLGNPLGIGMGNFGEVSADPANHIFGLSSFSTVAHNILLEFLVGMGVFGLVFWWWVLRALEWVWEQKVSLVSGLWLSLGVNFLLDSTYARWFFVVIWFGLLGMVSGSKVSKEK